MDRVPVHGAPVRGLHPAFGSQDARNSSNLAVQPAASPGSISLKKASVKVARPAGPLPAQPLQAAQSTPSIPNMPSEGPVKAAPKVEDGHGTPKSNRSAKSTPSLKIESPPTKAADNAAALFELFARLDASTLSSSRGTIARSDRSTTPPPTRTPVDDRQSNLVSVKMQQPSSPERLTAIKEELGEDMLSVSTKQNELTVEKVTGRYSDSKSDNLPPQDIVHNYLGKASEYIMSLPSDAAPTVDLVQTVFTKLRRPYAPTANLEPDAVEGLKARYLNAVVTFLQDINMSKKPVTKQHVEDILVQGNGDFLHLCVTFAEQQMIAIENLDHVVGLCNAIMNTVPKDEDTASSTPAPESQAMNLKDPLDGLKTWPAREKRENVPGYRTCILKGISGITSINQLQAFVWGGRIESLQLPQPGSGHAIVRFLTPEACSKYFEATENGITVPGQKDIIFVEKAPGPNSTNDVVRSCTEGDASRCIRAYDADEDWSDVMLLRLARGKGQSKREVDRIKRGKTAKGRSFVEFRFANIYNALQFKRQLMDDEEWEHCMIAYAPDPCEIAQGVHIKDKDESEKISGFF
ncbi:hypothetical protein N0V90_006055 [Kalmusia sp. IMI 367209]|nr:hypothetical protein N0V90_006055 [Kalmusia sp. IMI 367209]